MDLGMFGILFVHPIKVWAARSFDLMLAPTHFPLSRNDIYMATRLGMHIKTDNFDNI